MPYMESDGARLFYEERGSGQALVLLHGAAWDMGMWRRQVETFSSVYRVITPDARGHGKSTLPPGAVSPDSFWRDVVALLDHLNIGRATLCGLSLGGHTALQTAIHAPERVSRLILIGAPCTNRFNWYERLCVPINRTCMRLMPVRWAAWCLGAVLGRFNPEVGVYARQVMGAMDHDSFNRVWRAVTSMESRAGLEQIKCPTLILVGDHDALTLRQQPLIHRSIHGSRLVTIARAHHGANLDNPEQVEREIWNFLQA